MNVIVLILGILGVYLLFFEGYGGKKYAKSLRLRSGVKQDFLMKYSSILSSKIEPFITVDPLKQENLEQRLSNLNINKTAQKYTADMMAISGIYALVSMFLFLAIFENIFTSALIAAIIFYVLYSGETKKLKVKLEDKIFQIDKELVGFTSTIANYLRNTKDVIKILEDYADTNTGILCDEITFALNTAKTSDVENALEQMDRRINSTRFSRVITGLISVTRGENQKVYFDMLVAENISYQNELIKREGQKRLTKLKPDVAMQLGLLIMTVFVIMFTIFTNDFIDLI